MKRNIYERLREHLDALPIDMPKTEKGQELYSLMPILQGIYEINMHRMDEKYTVQ